MNGENVSLFARVFIFYRHLIKFFPVFLVPQADFLRIKMTLLKYESALLDCGVWKIQALSRMQSRGLDCMS